MSIATPFYRTARPHLDGHYNRDGRYRMIRHPAYADRPHRWVRAYLILQDDLVRYLEYVEPADKNYETYSLRGADLLIRTCIEVEANLAGVLGANKYRRNGKSLNVDDYFKVEKSHFLSQFRVQFPHWEGSGRTRQPFNAWAESERKPLPWYQAYNSVKHDRARQLSEATFEHLTDAWCGLVAVLTAQFMNEDFGPGSDTLALAGNAVLDRGFNPAIGSFLGVAFPENIPMEERYEFDWSVLNAQEDPFAAFDYDSVV